jgi:hypothetical protein
MDKKVEDKEYGEDAPLDMLWEPASDQEKEDLLKFFMERGKFSVEQATAMVNKLTKL